MRLSDAVLWFGAVALYFFGDILTTLRNLEAGMVELNPLSTNFLAVKLFVLFLGVSIYLRWKLRAIPAMLFVLGGLAVLHNIYSGI